MARPKSSEPVVSIREDVSPIDANHLPHLLTSNPAPSSVYSYERLGHAKRRPWIPWTLKVVGLIPIALFTALLILALALLQWQSARHGGLFFANLSGDFLPHETLLYRYLPTILIVFYGTVWSWVDLDAKRLEPWFQLARKNGSLGSDSLLLRYPLQFLPVVPVQAARKRQWVVVLASTVMILVVWAVTPLQNGIFAVRIVEVENPAPVKVVESPLQLTDQIAPLRKGFLSAAFGVSWLGQRPPPFTTLAYSLTPFEVSDQRSGARWDTHNQTLSAPTFLYQTSLECHSPPNISMGEELYGTVSVIFDDGGACAPLLSFPHDGGKYGDAEWNPFYIPYWNDPNLERALSYEGCPTAYEHSFLAVWAPNRANVRFDGSEAAALFCTPSYYKQPVTATVKVSDLSVVSTVPTGPKVPLLDTEFNATHFEYMIGVGTGPDSFVNADLQTDPPFFVDASRGDIVHQDSQLLKYNITVPANNMVGYALALSDKNLSKLGEPQLLREAFGRAHQLLFALAMHDTMASIKPAVNVEAKIHSTLQAVQVVRVFSVVSLSLLSFILLLTGMLLWTSAKRPNYLSRDPKSLAEIAAIADNAEVQRLLGQADSATEEALSDAISRQTYCLQPTGNLARPSLILGDDPDTQASLRTSSTAIPARDVSLGRVGPIEYSWLIGGPILTFLLAMAVGLILLHNKTTSENGTTGSALSCCSSD